MYNITSFKMLEQIYLNSGIHKRELSRRLKLGMPSINHALTKIKNILKEERSGNQIKYHLDYSKRELSPALKFVEHLRFEKLPPKTKLAVNDFVHELEDKPLMTILFGSYARGDYTNKSDIDILLVYQKIENSKKIENIAKRINMRTGSSVSPIYLDYKTFKESFHNSSKEFFKKLKKNKLILEGIEKWRVLVNEEA